MAKKNKKAVTRSAKAKREAAHRAPLLVENTKTCMFIRGHRTSSTIMEAVAGLKALKKPDFVTLNHKNKLFPFEDETSLEFLAQKNDCSLFVLGSHTKKRPDNLVVGRLYDFKVLDVVEFGVSNFKSMVAFAKEGTSYPAVGTKPCLLFAGPAWESSSKLGLVRNVLADLLRGPVVSSVNLAGLDHVVCFTVSPDESTVCLRHYSISFRKSGTKIPRVHLEECGPRMDLQLRRTQFADDDARKHAMKIPKQARAPSKTKNVSTNVFRDTMGQVHMDRQQLQDIVTAKPKALSKKRKTPDADDTAAAATAPADKPKPKQAKSNKSSKKK